MSDTRTFVVFWADAETKQPNSQTTDRLASSAAAYGGELLALGEATDVVEVAAARPVPSWTAIAGFGDKDAAATWYHSATALREGVAVLVPAHAEPVWWPAEKEGERPDWSLRREVPPDRFGLFVSVWIAEVTDLDALLDYSDHFRWTVERSGGVSLGNVPFPQPLHGDAGPASMTLMTFGSSADGLAWYGSAEYRPYRDRRHAGSNSTVIGVPARPGASLSFVSLAPGQ